jgi:hypothetical protein
MGAAEKKYDFIVVGGKHTSPKLTILSPKLITHNSYE